MFGFETKSYHRIDHVEMTAQQVAAMTDWNTDRAVVAAAATGCVATEVGSTRNLGCTGHVGVDSIAVGKEAGRMSLDLGYSPDYILADYNC